MLKRWGGFLPRVFMSSALALGVSGVLSGCGGSQGGPQSPGEEEASGGVGEANEPAAPRILEPASAPSGVVARMRIRNMAAIADSVMEAASVPLDWRRLLEKDNDAAPWLAAVDWEGSIEGVAAMNIKHPNRPHGAFSIGVRGLGPVLSLLEREDIVPLEGPGEVYYFEVGGDDCAVGPALGSSPARVVCSPRRTSLDLLLPYCLRGLPKEKLSSADVHMQFEMEPLRAAYGKELKTYLRWAPAAARSQHQGNPTFDRALSDGAAELAREGTALIDELSRVTVQVKQSSGDFTGSLDIELRGDQSDVVKVLSDLESRQKSVPPLFDEIPSTATAAGYSRSISKKYADKWMSILADLIAGTAELEGASRAFSHRVAAIVKQLGPQGATSVFARGPLVASQVGDVTHQHPAWVLSGTTRKKSDVVSLLDDISWVMASPELKKLAKDVPHFPEMKRKVVAIKGATGATVYEWALPPELLAVARLFGAQAGAGMGADDLTSAMQDFESGLVAVHEVGGQTWISWGKTKEELAESFRAISSKDAERLGALGALGGVRSQPAVSAGFAKIDGLVGMASFLFAAGILSDWNGLKKAMPNQGKTPIIYSFRVEKGATTKASWRVHVPAEFTQDLAALGVMLAQEKGMSLTQ